MKVLIVLFTLIAPFSAVGFSQDDSDNSKQVWTDPVTGGDWSFAHPALNWFDAMEACNDGFALPDHPTIAHALRRMKKTFIAEKLRDADAKHVWSSEELSWRQAMLVSTTTGSASGEWKRYLHPVLCYKAKDLH